MARGYEDLSRRALIKLDKDFDEASGGQLLDYLQEHDEEYEGTRFIEKVTERVDQVVDSIKTPGGPFKETMKEIAVHSADKITDAAIGIVKAAVTKL